MFDFLKDSVKTVGKILVGWFVLSLIWGIGQFGYYYIKYKYFTHPPTIQKTTFEQRDSVQKSAFKQRDEVCKVFGRLFRQAAEWKKTGMTYEEALVAVKKELAPVYKSKLTVNEVQQVKMIENGLNSAVDSLYLDNIPVDNIDLIEQSAIEICLKRYIPT